MAQQQTPPGSTQNRDTQKAGHPAQSGQKDQKQQFGSQAGASQHPVGNRSESDLGEDEESMEPVEHRSEDKAETDVDVSNESTNSSARKINR